MWAGRRPYGWLSALLLLAPGACAQGEDLRIVVDPLDRAAGVQPIHVSGSFELDDPAAVRAKAAGDGASEVNDTAAESFEQAELRECLSASGLGPDLRFDRRRAANVTFHGTPEMDGLNLSVNATTRIRVSLNVTCAFPVRPEVPSHVLVVTRLPPGVRINLTVDASHRLLETPGGSAVWQLNLSDEANFTLQPDDNGTVRLVFGAHAAHARFDGMATLAFLTALGALALVLVLRRLAEDDATKPLELVLLAEAAVCFLYAVLHVWDEGRLHDFAGLLRDLALVVAPITYLHLLWRLRRQLDPKPPAWRMEFVLGLGALLAVAVSLGHASDDQPGVVAQRILGLAAAARVVLFCLLFALLIAAWLDYRRRLMADIRAKRQSNQHVPILDDLKLRRARRLAKLLLIQYACLGVALAIPYLRRNPFPALRQALPVDWEAGARGAMGLTGFPMATTDPGARFMRDLVWDPAPFLTFLFLLWFAWNLFREAILDMDDDWKERAKKAIRVVTGLPFGAVAMVVVAFYLEKLGQGEVGRLAGGAVGAVLTYLVALSKGAKDFANAAVGLAKKTATENDQKDVKRLEAAAEQPHNPT